MLLLANLTPEIFLALGLSSILVWGSVVSNVNEVRIGPNVSFLSILVLFYVFLRLTYSFHFSFFDKSFDAVSTEPMAQVLKLVMVLATAMCLITVSKVYNDSTSAFEYPLLILLALLGMMILVSAQDLMLFYLALELQSLSLYVLAAAARGSAYSTEAGLKYFRLGAFASGLFLLGSSIVYGFLGTTDYNVISQLLMTPIADARPLVTGFLLILTAISFKLAAAPFHRWSPDVIEGSPTTSSMFFASVTKVAALGALIRICFGPFYPIWINFSQLWPFVIRSALSMAIGALAALAQRRIKRFMAYSAIGHRGFMLMGIASGTFDGMQATLRYLVLYVTGSLGIWCVIVNSGYQYLTELGGLAHKGRYPAFAIVIAVSMFSMAGVPPMAGFLAKLSVLFAAVKSSFANSIYLLAVFSVLASVVGAFYYLRVIKIMYFEGSSYSKQSFGNIESSVSNPTVASYGSVDLGSAWVMSMSTFITVFVLLNPTFINTIVQRATLSLALA